MSLRLNRKITNLDEENLTEIRSLCKKHLGWFMNKPDVTKRFITPIKFLDSFCIHDGVVINGRRLALSVIVTIEPEPTIKLQTYGHDVAL